MNAIKMHAYLDKFALTSQCVILEGWASDHNIRLFYHDQLVPLVCKCIERPDLVPVFGDEALSWGFACSGMLDHDASCIDRDGFRVDYGNGISEVNPQNKYSAPSDRQFSEMINRFRDSIGTTSGSFLEIGSRARSGSTYKGWFPDIKKYVGFDVSDGPNVDIVGDAHHLSRHITEKFDHIFSIAVFEHLFMPWKVAVEMNRILNTGGTALTITHFAWPLHEEPWDFWRYSKEAWGALFNKYTGFEIVQSGYQYPAMIVPFIIADENTKVMSKGPAYLLSGCLVRKTCESQVNWDVEANEILDVNYSHR